jgi:hypothetical protein
VIDRPSAALKLKLTADGLPSEEVEESEVQTLYQSFTHCDVTALGVDVSSTGHTEIRQGVPHISQDDRGSNLNRRATMLADLS